MGAALGGWAGDKLAGMLYDAIFKKKDTPKNKKKGKKTTTTIDKSNQPKTMDLLESGKRGNIEQALYNMRLNASKGSGEAFNDWVGNEKYAGDADLIMKHGLQNVIIESGRVTLKGNAENIIPLDVNSVSKKATSVSESASYEEGAEETIVVKSGSQKKFLLIQKVLNQ